ncbi:MAG TPA: hypothetical protein VH478_18840 [Trebonia sp.]|nr:hypothetical protein [Trebonia sp.]
MLAYAISAGVLMVAGLVMLRLAYFARKRKAAGGGKVLRRHS